MLCTWLNRIYGRDSRSTQVINVVVSALWAIGFLIHSHKIVQLNNPHLLVERLDQFFVFATASALFSLLGLAFKGRQHQVLKFFGLSLGAVLQSILASGYVTSYPPLETMLVINLLMLFWFLGALLYISKCEGFDGKYLRAR